MEVLSHIPPPKAELRAARARRARAWAWPVRIALVACLGVAIWQEPRIWPKAHDTMQGAAETLAGMLESNDRVRGFIAGLTGARTGRGDKEGLADRIAGLLSR